MKAFMTTLAMALVSSAAFAYDAEKWEGSGIAFSSSGAQQKSYSVSVVNRQTSASTIESHAMMTSANGTTKSVVQKISIRGSSWTVESNLGTRGGACYGKDICENYITGANGIAYATTIIKDGADHERQITFVLQDGKAIKIFRQSLVRIQ